MPDQQTLKYQNIPDQIQQIPQYGQIIPDTQINEVYPRISLSITIFELQDDGQGNKQWVAAITHTFHGDTIERIQEIMASHYDADMFFRASFSGQYDGIILKNSEPITRGE